MKTVDLIQGAPAWHAHRAQHFNSSDAPAMLGVSPHKTRAQLIREIATGITPEVDAATQRRFDDGHRCEALARPLAEQIIGDELYPCTGVDGRFSASFDGLTMLGDLVWEHKQINDRLRAAMVDGCTGADLPEDYRIQMEHQAMVSDAERVLFMASNWDADGNLVEERHCWYTPAADLRAHIVAGWEQLEADVAAYVPETSAAPKATGVAPDSLPALSVVARGMVEFSNLDEFREKALAAIGAVNRDLQTDDDFATAELTVKAFKSGEEKLDATKRQILGQMTDVDAVMRTIDEVSEQMRRVRLDLDKLVKAEKENRKSEIVQKARAAYGEHEAGLRAETKEIWIYLPAPDFGGAIKGKRTLSSMQDAVDTVLANAKIAANESAKHIRAALACLTEETEGHKHLFPDYRDFIAKPVDDIRALVRGRIAEHQRREAEKLEVERERIRNEEIARLEREQAEAAAQAAREKAAEASKVAEAAKPLPVEASAPAMARPAPVLAASAHAGAPPATAGARIKLGEINARIAPLSISADGLASLGFHPVGTERAAKLYDELNFPAMCDALVSVLQSATHQKAA